MCPSRHVTIVAILASLVLCVPPLLWLLLLFRPPQVYLSLPSHGYFCYFSLPRSNCPSPHVAIVAILAPRVYVSLPSCGYCCYSGLPSSMCPSPHVAIVAISASPGLCVPPLTWLLLLFWPPQVSLSRFPLSQPGVGHCLQQFRAEP